tara:strand:- start:706 stop:1065 length:360 start_codon:yes stop_codon:yes gene_type:complete
MARFLSCIIFAILILTNGLVVFAFEDETYSKYLDIWNKESSLASEYLLESEKYLKNGDKSLGCSMQKKASFYGIKSTEALIKAFKISKTTEDLSNLEAGLNKWKELGDFCKALNQNDIN